jgi:hypothetical protein
VVAAAVVVDGPVGLVQPRDPGAQFGERALGTQLADVPSPDGQVGVVGPPALRERAVAETADEVVELGRRQGYDCGLK